uniref:Uncharacterized protein n=1 Tax=Leersia perrieri TaxID=77586 RepID=A0A0D9WKG3_9ORYZ
MERHIGVIIPHENLGNLCGRHHYLLDQLLDLWICDMVVDGVIVAGKNSESLWGTHFVFSLAFFCRIGLGTFLPCLPLFQFDGTVDVFNNKNGSVGHPNKKPSEIRVGIDCSQLKIIYVKLEVVGHGCDQAGFAGPRWAIQQGFLLVLIVKAQLIGAGLRLSAAIAIVPFELCSFIHIGHLFTFLHANNHLLRRIIHAADPHALHLVVDACCKVAEAGEEHVTHLIWNQLVHDAANQHHRRCNGCSCCDGLLVGLDGLVVGRHGDRE